MERLIEIINRIYQKYLPKITEFGINFNLDFPDTTLTVGNHERIEKDLDKSVQSAIIRAKNGEIKIAVKKGAIIVSDTGLTIDATTCKKLSNEHCKVKSRVGFGTTVTINLSTTQA